MTPQPSDPPKSSILELTEMGQEYWERGGAGQGAEGGEQTRKMLSSGSGVLGVRKRLDSYCSHQVENRKCATCWSAQDKSSGSGVCPQEVVAEACKTECGHREGAAHECTVWYLGEGRGRQLQENREGAVSKQVRNRFQQVGNDHCDPGT